MFDDDDPTLVEGEMTVNSKGKVNRGALGSANFNTLDEPIKETFVSEIPILSRKMSWQNTSTRFSFRFSFEMFERLAVSSSTCYIQGKRTVCSKNGISGVRWYFVLLWQQSCKDHQSMPTRMTVDLSLQKCLSSYGSEQWS